MSSRRLDSRGRAHLCCPSASSASGCEQALRSRTHPSPPALLAASLSFSSRPGPLPSCSSTGEAHTTLRTGDVLTALASRMVLETSNCCQTIIEGNGCQPFRLTDHRSATADERACKSSLLNCGEQEAGSGSALMAKSSGSSHLAPCPQRFHPHFPSTRRGTWHEMTNTEWMSALTGEWNS